MVISETIMISIELQDVTKKPIKNTLFLFIFLSSENLKIELLIDNATIGINKLIVANITSIFPYVSALSTAV